MPVNKILERLKVAKTDQPPIFDIIFLAPFEGRKFSLGMAFHYHWDLGTQKYATKLKEDLKGHSLYFHQNVSFNSNVTKVLFYKTIVTRNIF